MRGKVTKRSVDALKLADGGAEAGLWDTEVKGSGRHRRHGMRTESAGLGFRDDGPSGTLSIAGDREDERRSDSRRS